jgi:hypothetical protein
MTFSEFVSSSPKIIEGSMLSSGLFTGVSSLNANVSEHTVCSIFIGEYVPTRL